MTRVDPQAVQRDLTRNVLSAGESPRHRARPRALGPGVTGHSINAVKGEGPFRQDTDGVVVYSSAHLDGMATELVVTSGHPVQQTPQAIEEVRRILTEHAAHP